MKELKDYITEALKIGSKSKLAKDNLTYKCVKYINRNILPLLMCAATNNDINLVELDNVLNNEVLQDNSHMFDLWEEIGNSRKVDIYMLNFDKIDKDQLSKCTNDVTPQSNVELNIYSIDKELCTYKMHNNFSITPYSKKCMNYTILYQKNTKYIDHISIALIDEKANCLLLCCVVPS